MTIPILSIALGVSVGFNIVLFLLYGGSQEKALAESLDKNIYKARCREYEDKFAAFNNSLN